MTKKNSSNGHANGTMKVMTIEAPALTQRFEDDDNALRKMSFTEGALGHNDSDYHNMWGLFLRIVRRAESIDNDPHAFVNDGGRIDSKAIDSWGKLVDNGRKILEGLNKMRNSDRLVLHVLETHTRSFAQAIAGPLGMELRDILIELEDIPEASHVASRLRRLINDGVRTMFQTAALETMARSRDEYKLH